MKGLWSPFVCSLGEPKFSWNSLGGKVFSRRKTLQGTRKHIPTDFGKRNNIIHSKVRYSLVCMGGMFSRFPRERHPWGDPVASLRWSCCQHHDDFHDLPYRPLPAISEVYRCSHWDSAWPLPTGCGLSKENSNRSFVEHNPEASSNHGRGILKNSLVINC